VTVVVARRSTLATGKGCRQSFLPLEARSAAGVACVGLLIAARLLVYQLGWTGPPLEPFFGDGTQRVVESAFSRALPLPSG
jgi:hypothetical protein